MQFITLSNCFFITFSEIICISSDSNESSETSSTSEKGPTWLNYFPPHVYGGTSTNVTAKKKPNPREYIAPELFDEKVAFSARGKVLGLPNAKTCADLGIKPWTPKIPKECGGKGKKKMG